MSLSIRGFRFCKSNDIIHLARHRAIDVTRYLLGGLEQETIQRRDIAARHAEARMTKQRLDNQFAEAQLVGRGRVGMAKSMRRIGHTDNSSPRVREDGRVRLVGARHARKDVFALGFDAAQDYLSSFWSGRI